MKLIFWIGKRGNIKKRVKIRRNEEERRARHFSKKEKRKWKIRGDISLRRLRTFKIFLLRAEAVKKTAVVLVMVVIVVVIVVIAVVVVLFITVVAVS